MTIHDRLLTRQRTKMFVNETFLTLYMTVNWHREFAVNFATFLKVCRDFFTFAP